MDMHQKYKYGVGQNDWIHDMAREKGVDDYELSKDGLNSLTRESLFVDSKKSMRIKIPINKMRICRKNLM